MPNIARSLRNSVLKCAGVADGAHLEPHLEAVDLPQRYQLHLRNRPIEHAYFFEHGIASIVANGARGQSTEIGIIGWEGFSGIALALGTDRSPHDAYMQVGGNGHRIAAKRFCQLLDEASTLRQCSLRSAHVFAVQAAETALTNARAKLEERLARWLLMARDRTDSDELPITHEFIALMLGVHRPGVTLALNALEQDGVIETRRGLIVVLDRDGLLQCTNGFYGASEKEHKRLFGG